MGSSRNRFKCLFGFVAGLAAMALPPAAAEPGAPQRVVSFNLCADQLLVPLADPAQIAGLSPYATDPARSVVAEQARAFRRVELQAESIVPLDPVLILAGTVARSATRRMLDTLGYRVANIDLISDLDGARRQVREVAGLLGQPQRGEALLADIDAAQRRLAAVPHPQARTGLLIEHGGYTAGPSSLAAAL